VAAKAINPEDLPSPSAEDGIADEQAPSCSWRPAEQAFEMIEVPVPVDEDLRAAEPAPVNDRGMVQCVAENLITFAHQRRNDSQIRKVSRREHQCGFFLLKACEPGFQPFMDLQVATDQSGATRRSMKLLDCSLRRRLDPRMGSQPEIIVAGEVHQLPAAIDGGHRAPFD
jgi:hypothetical protein